MGRAVSFAVVVLVTFGFGVPLADASRAPTRSERAAIKRVAVKACEAGPVECRFKQARVSTRNARYAWADVVGEGFSGATHSCG